MKLIDLLAAAVVLVSCSGNQKQIDYAEGIHDFDDLAGKKVSVISGALQDLEVSKMHPAPILLRMTSAAEILAAVESGNADYCLDDATSHIGGHLEERGLKQIFASDKCAGSYGFGFRQESKALCDEFNAFLQKIRASGEFDAITEKWTKGDVGSVRMPEIPMNPDGEIIRVGTFPFFPFTFTQENRNAGFEIELLERFAAETGRKLEFYVMDFSGLIAALVTGKIDIISAAMTITEERSKQIHFSDPYYYCQTVCICRDKEAVIAKKPFFERIKDSFTNNLLVENRWKLITNGLWETIVISIFSILLGTIFGGFVCWMRMSRRKLLRGTAIAYVDIIRGIPILVLLMIMFYVVFASNGLSPRWVAIIAFAMNFGAYVSEMYRTGIEGVDRGQTEAGLAMGFTPLKTFIFFVVPQAAKKVLPVFKGEAVSLIKNTSVVGFIAIQDLTKASEIIRARTFDAFFPLIIISIIYFILAWLLGKLIDSLANKLA